MSKYAQINVSFIAPNSWRADIGLEYSQDGNTAYKGFGFTPMEATNDVIKAWYENEINKKGTNK